MQVASHGVSVYCTDIADTYEIMAYSFYENNNEIIVCAEIYNTELQRGWKGDLEYKTNNTLCFGNCDEFQDIRDSWKDVLLAKIELNANIGEPNVWKYRFLKK